MAKIRNRILRPLARRALGWTPLEALYVAWFKRWRIHRLTSHADEVLDLWARPAPRVGDPAPDFTLPSLADGVPVTLSRLYRERPVVLIFGSYT